MPQTLLPFDYIEAPKHENLTGFAGVGLVLELLHIVGLRERLDAVFDRGEGWPASVMVVTLLLLHIVGGKHVTDVQRLMADKGLGKLFEMAVLYRLRGDKRRRVVEIIRRGGTPFPSPSSIARFLESFHDGELLKQRIKGKAVILPTTPAYDQLERVFVDILHWYWDRLSVDSVTLDMDASVIAADKRDAQWTYKKLKGYQPLNFWVPEVGLMLYTEFRDGNVPADYALLPALKDALKRLPEVGVELALRSDSAGHVNDLMRFCEEGKADGFGRIYFAITAKTSAALRRAILAVPESDWSPLDERQRNDGTDPVKTEREWAEVNYVPNALSTKKAGSFYRFIAVRRPIQNVLPLEEQTQAHPASDTPAVRAPVQSALALEEQGKARPVSDDPVHADDAMEEQLDGQRYRITAVITNMRHPKGTDPTELTHSVDVPDHRRMTGDKVIHWHRKRAGASEHAHGTLKTDLAAGAMPSGKYGVNAVWWRIGIFAMNLLTIFRQQVADPSLRKARTKRLRFWYIHVGARVTSAANRLKVRLNSGARSLVQLFDDARTRITALAEPPPASV